MYRIVHVKKKYLFDMAQHLSTQPFFFACAFRVYTYFKKENCVFRKNIFLPKY